MLYSLKSYYLSSKPIITSPSSKLHSPSSAMPLISSTPPSIISPSSSTPSSSLPIIISIYQKLLQPHLPIPLQTLPSLLTPSSLQTQSSSLTHTQYPILQNLQNLPQKKNLLHHLQKTTLISLTPITTLSIIIPLYYPKIPSIHLQLLYPLSPTIPIQPFTILKNYSDTILLLLNLLLNIISLLTPFIYLYLHSTTISSNPSLITT